MSVGEAEGENLRDSGYELTAIDPSNGTQTSANR
jgi:hypothetical protein